ncbi:hypothetical protein N5079_20800 [Planotetraspora sp. A-T 1434]|uniref:hypothetical protein n=1 Tax=Planotetraspora sp. A-T 1434 TaxID=2979219 RepID=UPI0021BEED13|nr:hypothetical protein [Planotetraspora sp. A-T 1434]MCT9932644.1 hypothetical protein [Planotetraspora sp. A-T 1434]
MAGKILLPIPGSVSVTFVVAAPERPLSPAVAARLRASLPAGIDLRIEEIGGGDPYLAPAVSRLSCPDCSPGVDPLIAVLIERTDGHLSITCTAPPGWPPAHLHACAQLTDQVAELTGGIRLDADSPRILPGPWRPRSSPSPYTFPIVDWLFVTCGPDDDGLYSMRTKGLPRFGLPDLRTRRLQRHHAHGWFHLFNGLAGVLVRRLFDDARLRPHGGVHALASDVVVSAEDVSVAHGWPEPDKPQEATVRLRHDVGAGYLTVLPPDGFSGGEARWRDHTALAMCGDDSSD